MEEVTPSTPLVSATDALLVAGAGLAYAGCSDGGDGKGSGGIVAGYFGVIPSSPAAPATATPESASRFLQQATFGPTTDEIDKIVSGGFEAWFSFQVRTGRYLHLARTAVDDRDYRVNAWWQVCVNGTDQLRQRMAFALSQIFVTSDADIDEPRGLAAFYDLLCEHAFGNYRDLLEAVTLSPVMGTYLSMVRNEKPDLARNIRPDENYAREIMQLFSVGLIELNTDGTPRLNVAAEIPTYTQEDIEGLAHVFTGWNYAGLLTWNQRNNQSFNLPMIPFEAFHDTDPKAIIGGVTLPAGRTAYQDLSLALDTLFNHPNVGPFISNRLILRLTTSNPTPAYVGRVAAIFNNDGQGTRGNLLAVLRAILFDPEAINGYANNPTTFGKLKEPLLRQTAIWRAFKSTPNTFLRSEYARIERDFGQAPMRSPSVFNFYPPEYSQPGAIANGGLASPEFALLNSTFITETTNRFFSDVIYRYQGASNLGADIVRIDITFEKTLAGDPAALVDHLDLLLVAGQMSAAMKASVVSLVTDTSFTDDGERRVVEAIYIIVTSPEFAIQR